MLTKLFDTPLQLITHTNRSSLLKTTLLITVFVKLKTFIFGSRFNLHRKTGKSYPYTIVAKQSNVYYHAYNALRKKTPRL